MPGRLSLAVAQNTTPSEFVSGQIGGPMVIGGGPPGSVSDWRKIISGAAGGPKKSARLFDVVTPGPVSVPSKPARSSGPRVSPVVKKLLYRSESEPGIRSPLRAT